MSQLPLKLKSRWMLASSIVVTIAGCSLIRGAIAQSYAPCEPPAANEYLLMVVYRSPAAQTQLQEALPRTTTTTVCDYLGTVVTRVSGFADAEAANSWAQFLSDVGGLQAFVARPVEAPPAASTPPTELTADAITEPFPSPSAQPELIEPSPTPSTTAAELAPAPTADPAPVTQPTPAPSASDSTQPNFSQADSPQQDSPPAATTAYNPQVLGTGYAVLVDYANRPEVAAQLRQVTASSVGLVSYDQRPYLLATYTTDLSAAATLLRTLSDRNFVAVIVDSRRAVLLTPRVAVE